MTKEVALKNETLPSVIDFEQFEGVGFGYVSKDDLLIPRIVVVQALSNQKKKTNKSYIENANDGDIVDATGKVILAKAGEKIQFLPVERRKEVIEWSASQQGVIVNRYTLETEFDIFLKQHSVSTEKTKQGNGKEQVKYKLPNGNEVVLYVNLYGILILEDSAKLAFLTFKGSSLRVEREFLNKVRELRTPNRKPAPIFYSSWFVGSKETSNSAGDTWQVFDFSKGPFLSNPLATGKTPATSNLPEDIQSDIFEAVKNLRDVLTSGEFQTDLVEDAIETRSDDIPF